METSSQPKTIVQANIIGEWIAFMQKGPCQGYPRRVAPPWLHIHGLLLVLWRILELRIFAQGQGRGRVEEHLVQRSEGFIRKDESCGCWREVLDLVAGPED